MSSSITYIKKLIRKGSRADSFSRRKPADKGCYRSREGQRHTVVQTQTNHRSHDSKRESVIVSRNDSEAFGFEIRTYNEKNIKSFEEDVFTCVCSVKEKSPAENAGLKTGDFIISVNSICVEGFEHEQIVDLIQTSCLLKLEILRGTTVKQKELEKKLHHLEWQLNEKWAELEMLIKQEERLRRGNLSRMQSDSSPSTEPTIITVPLC